MKKERKELLWNGKSVFKSYKDFLEYSDNFYKEIKCEIEKLREDIFNKRKLK